MRQARDRQIWRIFVLMLNRFHDIAWVHPTGKGENGIIAGALEDGSLNIWDADKLLDKDGCGFAISMAVYDF